MLSKHRQQVCDEELQQDHRVTEALFDLWKVNEILKTVISVVVYTHFLCSPRLFLNDQKLRTCWSKRLAEAAKDVFLSSLPAQTSLSAERCEKMWLDVGQELAAQLQQAEGATRRQLRDIQAELKQDGRVNTMGRAWFSFCNQPLLSVGVGWWRCCGARLPEASGWTTDENPPQHGGQTKLHTQQVKLHRPDSIFTHSWWRQSTETVLSLKLQWNIKTDYLFVLTASVENSSWKETKSWSFMSWFFKEAWRQAKVCWMDKQQFGIIGALIWLTLCHMG